MKIILSNDLLIKEAPDTFLRELKERLSFENEQWKENNRLGYWNGNTRRILEFFRENGNGLSIPRGYCGQLIKLCRAKGIKYELIDKRRTLPKVSFTFAETLREFQDQAVKDTLKKDFGTLAAPTGSGKTIMALFIIAELGQPAAIVVDKRELADQWVNRIETFLAIPKAEIGIIGNGKKKIGEKITVALVQSLCKCADEVVPHIGFLIVDECHHCPSKTFTDVVSRFDCRYQLGLSATLYRRDKLSRLIFWYLGDCHHEVKKAGLLESGDLVRWEVVTRETSFCPCSDPTEQYSTMISELCEDPQRNELIAGDVAKAANNGGGVCLILSDRKEHCRVLARLVNRHGVPVSILTGDTPTKERKQIVEDLNAGKVRVLASTMQLLSEGFDAKALQTLFMATPVRFEGKVIQTLGRILRPAPGKNKAVVIDYHDINVGVLMNSARARAKVYSQT
jgi:superfamily II DNA or RNA helicase